METWREELYHYGIKNMKWGKRKKTAAQEAESAARSLEGAVRAEQEERARNAKIHQNYYHNISWDVDHEGNKGTSMDVRKARYTSSKRASEKAAERETYAANRTHQVKYNHANALAISKYSKKATSKVSKAKQAIKSLFSKHNKGGKAVTTYHKRTDRYANNYSPLDPEGSGRQYKSTQYQPKKKKRR